MVRGALGALTHLGRSAGASNYLLLQRTSVATLAGMPPLEIIGLAFVALILIVAIPWLGLIAKLVVLRDGEGDSPEDYQGDE